MNTKALLDYSTKKCKHIFKKFPHLKEDWKNVYEVRRKKVGRKKAVYSADAVVISKALKEFTYKKPKEIRLIIEQKKLYSFYSYKKLKVYLTRDKDFVKDFPNAKHISEVENDEFASQVISEVLRKNKLKIDNNFYYVIEEGG